MLDAVSRRSRVMDEAAALAAWVRASVVAVRSPGLGEGAGVVWNQGGLVVTNHHVAPGGWAEVVLADGERLRGEVVHRSAWLDLAALQVPGLVGEAGVRPATVGDSRTARVGHLAIAVGHPLGERNAVTLGLIGGLVRLDGPGGSREALRLAIALRPGNSGGALADVQGRIIGIPHMAVGRELALAIPSHVVQEWLSQPRQPAGALGIAGQWVALSPLLARRLGLAEPVALSIEHVADGSLAKRLGLRAGDLLVGLGRPAGAAIAPLALREGLSRLRAGEAVVVTIVRDGRALRLGAAGAA